MCHLRLTEFFAVYICSYTTSEYHTIKPSCNRESFGSKPWILHTRAYQPTAAATRVHLAKIGKGGKLPRTNESTKSAMARTTDARFPPSAWHLQAYPTHLWPGRDCDHAVFSKSSRSLAASLEIQAKAVQLTFILANKAMTETNRTPKSNS